MMADWKARALPVEPSWKDRAQPIAPTTSPLESTARGAAQGLSFGLADEITGGAEAALKKLSGSPEAMADLYRQARDESRTNYKKAEKDNPVAFGAAQFGGAIAPAFVSGGATLPGLAAQGALQGFGSSEADLTKGDLKGTAKDTGVGLAIGAGTSALGNLVGKIPFRKLLEKAGPKLEGIADKLALNATGATGAQAAKFQEGAGKALRERGFVKAGDSTEDVAKRLTQAMDFSEKEIGAAIQKLDDAGVTASVDNVMAAIRDKIKKYKSNSSKAAIVRKLQGIQDDIINVAEETGSLGLPGAPIPIGLAETTKRGWKKASGNWLDPEAGQAAKTAYRAYMSEVEKAALEANPQLANTFMNEKEIYGLLSPIEEAAQRRVLTLNQSPIGGLLDTTATVAGEMASGGKGIPVAIGRRLLSPRVASTGMAIAEGLGKGATAASKLGAPNLSPLQAAIARWAIIGKVNKDNNAQGQGK